MCVNVCACVCVLEKAKETEVLEAAKYFVIECVWL